MYKHYFFMMLTHLEKIKYLWSFNFSMLLWRYTGNKKTRKCGAVFERLYHRDKSPTSNSDKKFYLRPICACIYKRHYWARRIFCMRAMCRLWRTSYPTIFAEPRTNISFRNQENHEHYNEVSALLLIEPPINMVTQFSLDFMHLCCLGVMKKMFVDFWLHCKVATQLSQSAKRLLSNYLMLLKSQIPEEFQRTTTRLLENLPKWKAIEFCFFLLYIGPIILKKVLPEQLYQHFLLFHVASRILCSADLAISFNDEAN